MSEAIVEVKKIYKDFKLPHERVNGVKQLLLSLVKSKAKKSNHVYGIETQHVLNGVSFEIKKGEFFGIVGRNGSGKSTLLKLLAGIYTPTSGIVNVKGTLTPFIELGVGFNPELTGRENVFLNGALLGISRRQMERMYDDIVEFAELDRFMDQKLKNYSSGMQVRLAFSIAIRSRSDILLIDEVLAVGDADFQRKCYDYFMSLKEKNQTVILVTHDMGAVRQYCDRAILIGDGTILYEGDAEDVAQEYQKLFSVGESHEEVNEDSSTWGEGGMKVSDVRVVTSEECVTITTQFEAQRALAAPIYGFTIYGPSGINIYEANTRKESVKTKSVAQGEAVEIRWIVPNIFADGRYALSVACCDRSATHFYEWVNHAASFRINKGVQTAGVINPDIVVKFGNGDEDEK